MIQLISGFMFLFWVVMLRLGSCLHHWPRSQLATGCPITLTGHSFSSFSSGYTKYACLHSTSRFGNLHYEIMYSSSFSFSYLGTILYWTGTLREYRQLLQVLFFSFSGVLNIVIWGTLSFHTSFLPYHQDTNVQLCSNCKILWDVIFETCYLFIWSGQSHFLLNFSYDWYL